MHNCLAIKMRVVSFIAQELCFQNIIVKRVCLYCNIPQRTETAVRCGRPRSVWPDLNAYPPPTDIFIHSGIANAILKNLVFMIWKGPGNLKSQIEQDDFYP